jgi:hypothetical protein
VAHSDMHARYFSCSSRDWCPCWISAWRMRSCGRLC